MCESRIDSRMQSVHNRVSIASTGLYYKGEFSPRSSKIGVIR